MELMTKKILLLSTTDDNGAHEAIYRIAKHFKYENHEVKMLVKRKTKSDDVIVAYRDEHTNIMTRFFKKLIVKILNKIKTKISYEAQYVFFSKDETSINTEPKRIIDLLGYIPDFIFVGTTHGFMNSTDLLNLQKFTNAKVFNITVDMNHFTGGCHFAWDCQGFITGCTNSCPAIIGKNGRNLAQKNFTKKLENAKAGNFQIIAGSGWTLKQASESKIYKNQNEILNVNSLIDTTLFSPRSRKYAKNVFNLDSNKFYVLMGCQNTNNKQKGFEYLLEALKILDKNLSRQQNEKIRIIIVSKRKAINFDEIPFQKEYMDFITDNRLLSLLYQACDVFVNSSIEDPGPMMVSEALACGTPVVGFDMGVVNNMVINDYNGYKAILKDSSDLAKGIYTIFNLNYDEYKVYSDNAVRQVEEFSSMTYAKKVFDRIMEN